MAVRGEPRSGGEPSPSVTEVGAWGAPGPPHAVKSHNPRLLVGLSALHFALFPIPIVTLFWTEQIGM